MDLSGQCSRLWLVVCHSRQSYFPQRSYNEIWTCSEGDGERPEHREGGGQLG